VIAFLLFFAVTSPDNAARIVQSIWDGLVHIANGIGEFIQRLSGNSSSA
jgi:hypothetical protein